MAITMLVAGPDGSEPIVGPDVAELLAELGISRISVLSDRSGVGVVLEGWAFDPAHTDEAVRAMFPHGIDGVRILQEVELVAVAGPSSAARDAMRRPGRPTQGEGGVGIHRPMTDTSPDRPSRSKPQHAEAGELS